ncbi:MAG: type VI secretion system contractile sheath large subunit [Phycisphaerales bacterium]|nr:MAG: type VI secretion system contractile sheath large subunit [Phycisphaerales bacterium]
MATESVRGQDKCQSRMEFEFTTQDQTPAESTGSGKAVVRGQVQMHATLARQASSARRREQGSMNILLMGDFSGRESAGDDAAITPLGERRVRRIDIDNVEKVMADYAPQVRFPAGVVSDEDLVLQFRELEDFHPDELYRKLDVFQALRDTRQRLMDPATFADTAARLQQWAAPPERTAAEDVDMAPGESEDGGSTFERLLGGKPSDTPATRRTPSSSPSGGGGIDDLIRRIVEPHIVPAVDPQRDQLVSSIDDATGALMRAILHDQGFRAMEAAWRSVFDLVQNVESSEELKLFLLDVTKEELAADIAAAPGDVTACGLYRLLVEKSMGMPGAEPWSVLVGDYAFGPGGDDIGLLSALATIASHAGAPLLAAADPALLGCESIGAMPNPTAWSGLDEESEELWNWLRRSPQAMWLGLVLPRLLLRLPYGKNTEQLDSFGFEEIVSPSDHESYLWGNGAFACGRLIAESFVQRGWSMQLGDCLQIDEVPAHVYVEDGESKMKPCAEAYLSERAMEAVLGRGPMVLVSFVNRNVVRLARFQSLSDPPRSLAGPWEG